MKSVFQSQLNLAFAGKRILPDLNKVNDALSEFFAKLSNRFPETGITMLNGLAEGADQLAAKSFLDYFPKGSLVALLPFEPEDFVQTIQVDEAKSFFNDLLNRPHTKLISLPNAFDAQNQDLQNLGFQDQSRHLLQRGDFLLAISDSGVNGKPGGTDDTIDAFRRSLKPAFIFDIHTNKWLTYKNGKIVSLSAASPEISILEEEDFTAIIKYRRDLEDLAFTRKKPSVYLKNLRDRAYLYFDMIMRYGWQKALREVIPLKLMADRNFNPGKDENPIWEQYLYFDALAQHYASLYRGGYLLNYLGFVAAVGVAGLALALFALAAIHGKLESTAFQVGLIMLGFLKLLIILKIVSNTKDIHHDSLNSKHIDFRYVAERLRIDEAILSVGIRKRIEPALGKHLRSGLDGYNGQLIYVQVWDQLNLKIKGVTSPAISDIIKDQKEYHEKLTVRYTLAEDQLEELSETLNKAVLWMVGADIGLGLGYLFMHHFQAGQCFTTCLHHFHEWGTPILILIALVLPSLVAAIYGIRSQSEFHRLGERSSKLHPQLLDFDEKIALEHDPQEKENLFMEAAQMLLDEVAEWTLIYEKKTPEL